MPTEERCLPGSERPISSGGEGGIRPPWHPPTPGPSSKRRWARSPREYIFVHAFVIPRWASKAQRLGCVPCVRVPVEMRPAWFWSTEKLFLGSKKDADALLASTMNHQADSARNNAKFRHPNRTQKTQRATPLLKAGGQQDHQQATDEAIRQVQHRSLSLRLAHCSCQMRVLGWWFGIRFLTDSALSFSDPFLQGPRAISPFIPVQ